MPGLHTPHVASRSRHVLRRLLARPPREVVGALYSRLTTAAGNRIRRRADLRQGTWPRLTGGPLRRSFGPQIANAPVGNALCGVPPRLATVEYSPASAERHRGRSLQGINLDVCRLYLEHRFNLLGSGWVQVRHGMRCRGLAGHRYEIGTPIQPDPQGRWLEGRINSSNLDRAQQVWRLVDDDYVPIDWQLDFKSGYRWGEAVWSGDIPLSGPPGSDIKVPWELARMQHLPQMALAYAMLHNGPNEPAGIGPIEPGRAGPVRPGPARLELAREFRNQVLDFIATNPPRFGVNWRCAMDVGIRAANWLVAWDLFRAAGAEWDADFDREFASAVYAHALHVANNLEETKELRGNHYLADIAGLLFAAAWLPSSEETDAWLAFAVRELITEVGTQFQPDGTNFEASTSYHRLSAEIVAWCTSLVLALPPERRSATPRFEFPPWYVERLYRMAAFTVDVTKPTGCIHQVGDNDGGRFLNLQPVFRRTTVAEARSRYPNLAVYDELPDDATYWDEEVLDHRSVVAAINGLLGRAEFEAFHGPDRVEAWLIRGLCQCGALAPRVLHTEAFSGAFCGTLAAALPKDPHIREYAGCISLPEPAVLDGLQCRAYPDFGLYIWRSDRLYLAVRCGPVGQNGIGGHAHNDQLALELTIDDQDLIADPGTYLYTADPETRNSYRSVTAHSAPRTLDGREPDRLDLGLFRLGNESRARCLYFGPDGFVGVHCGYGRPVYRAVRISPEAIVITDYADERLPLRRPAGIEVPDGPGCAVPFSPGYGVQYRPHEFKAHANSG